MSTSLHFLPDGRTMRFLPRSVIDRDRVAHGSFRQPSGLFEIPLPVDWSKGGTLRYPIVGNDQAGDCMYAAAIHLDQTFTGNVGAEAQYDTATVLSYYRRLSGGDNGLSEQQIVSEWHAGLCGNKDAAILDSLDIDVTDAALVRTAIYCFGGVQFIASLPNRFINGFASGVVWDAPASPNPANGHGMAWVGCDEKGRYRLLTWGDFCWITPAGVACCDPSGFVVFSLRWFDKDGFSPNGLHYVQLAELWVQAGGRPLPPSPYPDPMPN